MSPATMVPVGSLVTSANCTATKPVRPQAYGQRKTALGQYAECKSLDAEHYAKSVRPGLPFRVRQLLKNA